MCFLRVLGHGKHIFKDWVHLIMHFYSRSEYHKPLECWTNYFNFGKRTTCFARATICIHFGHISVYKWYSFSRPSCAFLRHLCVFWRISDKPSARAVDVLFWLVWCARCTVYTCTCTLGSSVCEINGRKPVMCLSLCVRRCRETQSPYWKEILGCWKCFVFFRLTTCTIVVVVVFYVPFPKI